MQIPTDGLAVGFLAVLDRVVDDRQMGTAARDRSTLDQPRSFIFSEARIAALQPGTERQYFSDEKIRSLKICVYESGSKVFVLNRRIFGRPERLQIGRHPDVSVLEAGKIAQRMLGEIAVGKRPAESSGKKAVGALLQEYMTRHAEPHKQASSVHEDRRLYERYIRHCESRRLSTLTRADIEHLHQQVGAEHGKLQQTCF
jgi:hypothetical protein